MAACLEFCSDVLTFETVHTCESIDGIADVLLESPAQQ